MTRDQLGEHLFNPGKKMWLGGSWWKKRRKEKDAYIEFMVLGDYMWG